LIQLNVSLIHQVDQSPGGGHEQMSASVESANLMVLANASVDEGLPQREMLAINSEAFSNLNGELSRWSEHKHERLTGNRPPVRSAKLIQNGQCEGGRFAGSRLRTAEDIAARECKWDCARLDGRGDFVAFVSECAMEGGN
jgi:hypothetical protein